MVGSAASISVETGGEAVFRLEAIKARVRAVELSISSTNSAFQLLIAILETLTSSLSAFPYSILKSLLISNILT